MSQRSIRFDRSSSHSNRWNSNRDSLLFSALTTNANDGLRILQHPIGSIRPRKWSCRRRSAGRGCVCGGGATHPTALLLLLTALRYRLMRPPLGLASSAAGAAEQCNGSADWSKLQRSKYNSNYNHIADRQRPIRFATKLARATSNMSANKSNNNARKSERADC